MTFQLSEFKRLAGDKRSNTEGEIVFCHYCVEHADAIIERLEKLEKVAEAAKESCYYRPRSRLSAALKKLEGL